jgi:photosystem II stability/assembly factor-like uncharacterized protein
MRPFPTLAALFLLGVAATPITAAVPRYFDDAALHAVAFADAREGWAVGDEGVVWHTIDAGKTWERQTTGVRASLRSLCFLNPYVGWVVGREELPAGGSAGVVLYTKDGGLHWRRVLADTLPGLNCVCFADAKNGFLAGDGTDGYPSGVFATRDGGRTWQPVPGPRATSWRALACTGPGEAALAGAWNRQGIIRRDRLHLVDSDLLGGRTLRGLWMNGEGGAAVGEGGLVLVCDAGRGSKWNFAPQLPAHAAENWDFHALHGVGRHCWAVGRPGSAALHSADGGKTWEVVLTGQTLPLDGIFFSSDEQHGWAVGELGTVIATSDGGKSWRMQRRGGQRPAVLCVHARAAATPLDTLALLGLHEGYLTAALKVTAPDPSSADPGRAAEGQRFAEAARQSGAAAGESLWQFPLPSHLVRAPREDLLRAWNQLHGGRAPEELLRQLVLALRTWRPEVVLTDAAAGDCPADGLVAEALRVAFERAADPHAFPEQIQSLGLEPWTPVKLYALAEPRLASVVHDLVGPDPLLEGTVKEFVSGPAGLLDATVPSRRGFRLLESRLQGATAHQHLMQGVDLAPGGLARRPAVVLTEPSPELCKALRQRTHLLALAEAPPNALTTPDKLLAQIGPMLAALPEDAAARAAHAVAAEFVRRGQWALAREVYLMLIDRYPTHPLTLDACRWVLRHNASSEARRRHELGQFLVTVQRQEFDVPPGGGKPMKPDSETNPIRKVGFEEDKEQPRKSPLPEVPQVQVRQQGAATVFANPAQTRQWYQSSLELESRLAGFGPLVAADPSIQFCLQAAKRNLGQSEEPLTWYEDFARRQPPGPWRSAAEAELWLAQRAGPPPKPVLKCRAMDTRPVLDGRLDDACWQNIEEVRLQNAAGQSGDEYATGVRLAFDKEFLYLAARCKHPADRKVPPVQGRERDADLRGHDRISLLLDLDRDYSTCYHLQIDQRGCVCEDCWGDKSWNPRWFVAVRDEDDGWVAEAAIPLTALSGDAVSAGRAWACNVVRVLPGRGVQALSLPAEAPEEALRPEGMGLLLFSVRAKDNRP